jgi:hypothetical protein
MKVAVFAAMMKTAGVQLDPDPFHYWEQVEERLDSYQTTIDSARDLMTQTNVFRSIGGENIPPKALQRLRRQWRAAALQAERARDHAQMARPRELKSGETFAVKAVDGLNAHFRFLGFEVGGELGNVKALVQLTNSGKTEIGHRFLLTTLTTRYGKAHLAGSGGTPSF